MNAAKKAAPVVVSSFTTADGRGFDVWSDGGVYGSRMGSRVFGFAGKLPLSAIPFAGSVIEASTCDGECSTLGKNLSALKKAHA